MAYVPSSDPGASTGGYLLFVRGGTLMAQSFDDRRMELANDAVPIAERLSFFFSVVPSGLLVYRAGAASPTAQMTWFDRKGNSLGIAGDLLEFADNSPLALAPDGKRVAFASIDRRDGNTDIWLYEFARSVTSRFTLDPGEDFNPVWSPDGESIVYAGHRGGSWGIYQRASNLVVTRDCSPDPTWFPGLAVGLEMAGSCCSPASSPDAAFGSFLFKSPRRRDS